LADLAAPEPRPVPDLGPFAVPDQIAVTARDLVACTELAPGSLEAVVRRIEELAALVPNAMTPPS
jgi:hypothetical protein